MNVGNEYQGHICFQCILSQNIAKIKVVMYGSVEVPTFHVNKEIS